MKKLKLFPTLFLMITLFFGCYKHDDVQKTPDSLLVSEFLNVPAGQSALLTSIANDLRRKDSVYHFLDKIATTQGVPVWQKSLIYNEPVTRLATMSTGSSTASEELQDSLAFIPLIKDTLQKKTVSAFIAVNKRGDEFRYRLVGNGEYYKAGFEKKDNDINANDILNFYLTFQKSIFHTSLISLTDKRLYKEVWNAWGAKGHDTTKSILISLDKKTNTPSVQINGAISIQVCSSSWEPGGYLDGSGGGTYELVQKLNCSEIMSFWVGDGGVNVGGFNAGGNPFPPSPLLGQVSAGGGNGNGQGPDGGGGMGFPDPNGGGNGYNPVGEKIEYIATWVPISYGQLGYLFDHPDDATFFYDQLQGDIPNTKILATLMTIEAKRNGFYYTGPYNDYIYGLVKPYMPAPANQVMNNPMFWRMIELEVAILKIQNPSWSWLKCYWTALEEVIMDSLDLIGMVPVVGEVADLTSMTIYTIQGDGVNAAISGASMIPVAGWFSSGIRLARKTFEVAPGVKRTIKWVVGLNQKISFGSRNTLRRVLNLPTGDLRQAHHLVPWEFVDNEVVQKAAQAADGFNMNEALNGIPLPPAQHVEGMVHAAYNTRVGNALQEIATRYGANLTPDLAKMEIELLINKIKAALLANPGVNLNYLIF